MASVPSQTIRETHRRHSWRRRTSARQREPVDGLCMTQACRGALLDLHCALEQWAGHYEIPSEALRAMVSDLFVFERSGLPRLSPEEFAAYANEIIAEEAAEVIGLPAVPSVESVEPNRLLKQGERFKLQKGSSDMTEPRRVEVLAPPSMAEWISNCAAGRPLGETPQLIGPETLFEKVKFCRSNIASLGERLSEEITLGSYEDADETRQELKYELHLMAEILEDIQDSDSNECSNEPEEFEEYVDESIAEETEPMLPGIPLAELAEPDRSR